MSTDLRAENCLDRYADYDRFAWFYQRYWAKEFARPALSIFDLALFPHLAPGARLLDLCCGTGELAAGMIARGFRVTGLDRSSAMLDYARRNAPAAELIRADARCFALRPVFAAAVSTFDSLNHVLELEELTAVFRQVEAALIEDGIFLFDLNMEEEFVAANRESTFHIVEDDHACLLFTRYDPQTRLKHYELEMFRRQEKEWRRSELTLIQRYYRRDEILAALEEAGFGSVRTYDARREFGLTISEGRAFFIARKRSRGALAPLADG